jgi:trehalose/maltose transport system substrate-binding protein
MSRHSRSSFIRLAALLGLAALTAFGTARSATLSIGCSGLGEELDLCAGAAQAWSKKTGHVVKIVAVPNDASERLALYQRLLGSSSDKIDVLQLDVAQVGLLAPHLQDLAPYSKGAERAHFPGMVANGTLAGRLVAMPWFIDAGLLYYRRDLLEKHRQAVPQTWDELSLAAQKIQSAERSEGKHKIWGYVWQGRPYEGLTCNALEWLSSFGAGTLVDEAGRVTVGTPAAAKALAMGAGWIGSISPRAVLNFAEEESRQVFQDGNAVFMRNWPYAWALLQAQHSLVKDKVGIALLPKGSGEGARSGATLGGQELAVSRYSENVELAASLVMHLTSREVQKERAIKGSYHPTITDLYADGDFKKSNPYLGVLQQAFAGAVARPSGVTGAKYNQVSSEFWNAAHEALSKTTPPAEAVSRLDARLKQVGRGGKW